MGNLLRRVKKLEAQLTDNGLIPYSQAWFDYNGEEFDKMFRGEEGHPVNGLAYVDAIMAMTDDEASCDAR